VPRLKLDPLSPSGVSFVTDQSTPTRQGQGYVINKVTGLITAGANVTITGQGTAESPYTIASSGSGGGGSSTWGSITGTLSSQTDLQTALNGKLHNLTSTTVSTVSTTVTANTKQGYDATAGTLTATLPASATLGDIVFIQKTDSSANVLNISGHINGTAASTLPVRTQLQGKLLQWTGATWEVIAGDLSLPALDARFNPLITATTSADYYRGDKTFQTLNQDAVPSGTTNKAYTSTEQTKLSGIATGATANSSDATLLARANHTGTQAESTVTNLVTDLAAKAPALNPTAVKSSAYTLAANDYVPVDTTSAAVTLTLPTAPANGTRVGAKLVTQGGTNTVTINAGGSDVFNKTGGSTSVTLTLLNQSIQFQYSSGIWYGVAADIGLTALDARYQKILSLTTTGTSGAATLVGTTLNIPQYSGGGTTITNNYNTTRIDAVNAGTTPYGALAGLVNGSNALFTVSNGSYVTGTLRAWLNGQLQTIGTTGDVTETTPASGTFTFAIAPPTGAIIVVAYITQTTSSGATPQIYSTKTSAYSMASTDYGILANATSAAFNLTPPATTVAGMEVIVKKIDASANAVTVIGTIDGATNYALSTQNKYVRLVTTSTSGTFYVVGNN
jgi:hypothetical protein